MGFPGSSNGKESACNAGGLGLITGSGRSPGEGNGNPLQYSCQENPMDERACWATVCWIPKNWTWLNDWHFHFFHTLVIDQVTFISSSVFLWEGLEVWLLVMVSWFNIRFIAVVVDQSLSHVWLCDLMDWSTPGFPVFHCLSEFAHTHIHWVWWCHPTIQPSHHWSPPSPILNLAHQGIFQWVGSSQQVAKELEFQHQFFLWIFTVDFL